MSTMLGAPRRALLLVSLASLAFAGLAGGALAAGGAATEAPDETFVASTDAAGEVSEGVLEGIPTISADGRLVAFLSASANLDPEGTGTAEAYVKDLGTGLVTIASRADGLAGAPASEPVEAASLAADGRYLAFATAAEGIVAGVPGPPAVHVYRRDLQTGRTEIADRADGAAGAIVPSAAGLLAISADGDLVAFSDGAAALDDPAAPHPEGEATIYVRDLATGTTTIVAAEGAEEASFSTDDRYLLFTSEAPTLPGADGTYQTYRRDLATGETVLVSRTNPTPAAPDGEPSSGEAYEAVFVGGSDCRVAFMGKGPTNLAPGVAPSRGVYVRDFCALPPTTNLLSVDEGGSPLASAEGPSTTNDGRIAFVAQVEAGETTRLYVRDPASGRTTLLGRASGPEGEPADREVMPTRGATIAAGGCRAVFTSDSRNLVDEGERVLSTIPQAFVRQLAPCRQAPEQPGTEGPPVSSSPGEAPRPASSPGPGAAPGPPPAGSIRITGAGRRGLWLAFDGAGRARVRLQEQAPGGGWKLIGSIAVVATEPGVVHVVLPTPGEATRRLKVRLQGDPDDPTLTWRLGGGGRRGGAG